MKFLSKDGEIVEGEPLTETQLAQRAEIVKLVHEKVCHGSFYGSWERKQSTPKCEQIANFFVTKFSLTPLDGVSMAQEIDLAEQENAP